MLWAAVFQSLLIRHLLDPMHCEKNITENVLRTIWGQKDTLKSRLDLQEAKIRPHLHPLPGMRPGSMILPKAPYVLSKTEKKEFVDTLQKLRPPSSYVGSLRSMVTTDGDLRGLKSHDYHVLMQQLLPLCVRTLLDPTVRVAIIRLSRLFQRLCAKTVALSTLDALYDESIVTMCMMEKVFPPSFFDVMSHLPIHLVQQLRICGPVHNRWMYPIERYLKTLKGYVKQRARPEGSMARGYIQTETMGFCTEYLQGCTLSERRIWDGNEEPKVSGEVISSRGRPRKLTIALQAWIHEFVLTNAEILTGFRE